MKYAIQIENLRHLYQDKGGAQRFLLDIPNLNIPMGSWTTFLGPSGCGKSTLENILGLIRSPCVDSRTAVGTFMLNEDQSARDKPNVGHDIASLFDTGKHGRKQIEDLRRRMMGFYLQAGELIPTLTIKENVEMPLRLNGWSGKEAASRVDEVLSYLLDTAPNDIPNKLALKLSGGQYQRVALARAIAHNPQILFVDEPTSSLDQQTARRALDLLAKLIEERGTSVVMVTHNETLALEYSDCIVRMDSPAGRWSDQVSLPPRDGDAWGTITKFEVKSIDGWQATNSHWVTVADATKETQDVA
jgi:putative ABC transport system ATP-binding protein